MTKQRVKRTRAGGRWTEARFMGFIRSKLREGMRSWAPKQDVKVNNRRKKQGVRHFEYNCKHCRGWFPDSQIEVDHIEPAGSLKNFNDLPAFVEKLYCEEDGLQILCKPCHKIKTAEEREARKKK